MTLLADLLATVFERRFRPSSDHELDARPISELTEDLLGATGEVSGLSIAQQILGRYEAWEDAEKRDFFHHLARDLNISTEAARAALAAYEAGQTRASYRALIAATEPPRQEAIRRLNTVPGATKTLVRMRADLLRLGAGDDALEALDLDFRHLFASWFNLGFLVLRPINWHSPAHILEKIIAYEAVHAINSWDELRLRLEPSDRRCFAFFHPAMPDEPLIFVEVALSVGVPGSVQAVLSSERDQIYAHDADTAVFYSISNCQDGLAGISFGNFLIKQVVSDLSSELPELGTFVTLSPIPGFVDWLGQSGQSDAFDTPEHLLSAVAQYLIDAKRSDGLPLDPVARFHLGNGAMIHKLHADADISEKGLRQSLGVMVNYLYDLDRITQNHERFAVSHEVVASSDVQSQSAAAPKTTA